MSHMKFLSAITVVTPIIFLVIPTWHVILYAISCSPTVNESDNFSGLKEVVLSPNKIENNSNKSDNTVQMDSFFS